MTFKQKIDLSNRFMLQFLNNTLSQRNKLYIVITNLVINIHLCILCDGWLGHALKKKISSQRQPSDGTHKGSVGAQGRSVSAGVLLRKAGSCFLEQEKLEAACG